jgi:hypothetical protein
VILRYPYAGVDFREDPDMVLPPGEVFDRRGMLMMLICMFLCFLRYMPYVYDIDVDTICCWFVCADVAAHGSEVEL